MILVRLFFIATTCIFHVYTSNHGYVFDNAKSRLAPHHSLDETHETQKLGKFRPRIFNGRVPDTHELPFMAYIIYRGVNNDDDLKCTGTIIAPKYVLTALHCIGNAGNNPNVNVKKAARRMVVKVGSQSKDDAQIYYVADALVTEKTQKAFRARKAKGIDDIVVLKLKENINLDNVTAAAVTLRNYEPVPQEVVTVAGYGVHVIGGRSVPEKSYVIGRATVVINKRTDDHFLTWDKNEGAAQGDSGCPALKFDHRQYYQVGMNTKGYYNKETQKVTGTYLKIGSFCDFIQNATNGTATCVK